MPEDKRRALVPRACIDHILGYLLWDVSCYGYWMGQEELGEACEYRKGLGLCDFQKRQVFMSCTFLKFDIAYSHTS